MACVINDNDREITSNAAYTTHRQAEGCVLQRESAAYDRNVALAGVVVTAAALIASLALKYADQLRLKQR